MLHHRVQDPVLWCATPTAVHLLDVLPRQGLVYDCSRDWSSLPDQWESELALTADVVFAASPELCDHIGPCSDNVALLPNGANYTMFARADLEIPPALRDISGPVLGYEGTIWHDLDLEPLLRAAREHPAATFVLVGRVERNPHLRALERLPNVLLLGRKPLVELPEYLDRFDVCLNLLRTGSMDGDILPPRIFEYFATGKPVVSMLLPGQVEQFPDVVYGAHTSAEFSQLCTSALAGARLLGPGPAALLRSDRLLVQPGPGGGAHSGEHRAFLSRAAPLSVLFSPPPPYNTVGVIFCPYPVPSFSPRPGKSHAGPDQSPAAGRPAGQRLDRRAQRHCHRRGLGRPLLPPGRSAGRRVQPGRCGGHFAVHARRGTDRL